MQDSPDFAPLLNYASGVASPSMAFDKVLGTLTLPPIEGWVSLNIFVTMLQQTAFKDFTVLVFLEVDGVPASSPSGTGYIPQQSSNFPLTISATYSRPVNGDEVLRLVMQLQDTPTATFDILDSTFEARYAADLASGGGGAQGGGIGGFTPGQLP